MPIALSGSNAKKQEELTALIKKAKYLYHAEENLATHLNRILGAPSKNPQIKGSIDLACIFSSENSLWNNSTISGAGTKVLREKPSTSK